MTIDPEEIAWGILDNDLVRVTGTENRAYIVELIAAAIREAEERGRSVEEELCSEMIREIQDGPY